MIRKNHTHTDFSSGAFYLEMMEQLRDIVLVVDECGSILNGNKAAITAYGYNLDELRKMRVHDLRAPENRAAVDAQLKVAQQDGTLFRTVHMRRTGKRFPVEVGSRCIRFWGKEVVVSIVRDITETVAMETATRAREEKYRHLHEELTVAYEELAASEEELKQQFDELQVREEAIRRQNIILASLHETALELMQKPELNDVLRLIVSKATDLLGTEHGFIRLVDEEKGVFCSTIGLGHYAQYKRDINLSEGLSGLVYKTGEIVVIDDYSRWENRIPEPFFDQVHSIAHVPLKVSDKVIGTFGVAYLTRERKFADQDIAFLSRFADLASIALKNAQLLNALAESEKKMQKMAYHDALTGLPNRLYLKEYLDAEMEKAHDGEAAGAILFIDLDDLKMINDTFGHSYGDSVIIKAGAYINVAAGEKAMVARIGGDEFLVVLPGEVDREKVKNVADDIVKLLERDYEVGVSSSYLSASVGIALYPEDGGTAQDILKNADLALYAAKRSGKNTARFYESTMQKSAYENMIIKQGLREAIRRNELSLRYQPLVDALTSSVVSFEALLRWTSPELGSVPPGRFIPLAEESDSIQIIGKWVFCEACRFARSLSEIGRSDIRVSVNVSPRQLAADDFVPFIREAIDMAGIKPNQLEIEITENALISSMEESSPKLRDLRTLGVHLSLDDFGSGYCSLIYLKKLPVESLKIDKSFIDEIESDEVQLRFLNSIVNMAHIQRLRVVAEGVETQAQLDRLRDCQCDVIQGYLFSRPLPAEAAMSLLNA